MRDFINQEFEAGHVWRLGAPRGVRFDLSPSAPPPRNIAAEGRDTLQAQIDLAPQQYEATAKYSPKYAALAQGNLNSWLFGDGGSNEGFVKSYTDKINPAITRAGIDASHAQREADINDVTALGGKAVEAFQSANPEQQALVRKLNDSAMEGLNAGYTLPSSLKRTVTQASRAATSDRGLGFGPNAAVGEAVANSGAAADWYDKNFTRAESIAGINQATSGDPFQLVTGRASGAAGLGLTQLGQQGVGSSGAPTFDPFSAYGSDVNNTNYNADAASRIAGSNNDAAVLGGALSY